jgi:hypothetical protein
MSSPLSLELKRVVDDTLTGLHEINIKFTLTGTTEFDYTTYYDSSTNPEPSK